MKKKHSKKQTFQTEILNKMHQPAAENGITKMANRCKADACSTFPNKQKQTKGWSRSLRQGCPWCLVGSGLPGGPWRRHGCCWGWSGAPGAGHLEAGPEQWWRSLTRPAEARVGEERVSITFRIYLVKNRHGNSDHKNQKVTWMKRRNERGFSVSFSPSVCSSQMITKTASGVSQTAAWSKQNADL